MKRDFLQNLKVGDQALPKEVIDAIMEENGRDIQGAKIWQEKYNQAVTQHQQRLSDMNFQMALHDAIIRTKGRSVKAISSLLDVDALRKSEDPATAIEQALESLKKDCDYLFETTQAPPPYARGTGSHVAAAETAPTTLAGALRERFEKERK